MNTTPRRIHDLIVELSGGSAHELALLLTRLRDERPELYRAFIAEGCLTMPRADDDLRAPVNTNQRSKVPSAGRRA
jgi:hypothetical protein